MDQLPAIQFQYVISGIIPAIIIATALVIIVFSNEITVKFDENRVLRWAFAIVMGLIILAIAFEMLVSAPQQISQRWDLLIKDALWRKTPLRLYLTPLLYLLIYILLVSICRFLGGGVIVIYKFITDILFFWYSFLVYFTLYPHLPQELGGPEPRCAYLDLVREEIAPASLSALAPTRPTDVAGTSESKGVRSSRLRVYFSSSDYMLVGTTTDVETDSGTNLKDVSLYELRKDVVRAVQWCTD